jgi:hypothetical protein
MKIKFLILVLGVLLYATGAQAQATARPDLLYSNRFSLLFGLLQPVALKGYNVEVNYFTKRLSFDYSHGVSLDPPTVGDFKDNKLALHLPYSTGFGVGYRFSSFFDVRFEPKLHSWEVYAEGKDQVDGNRLAAFKTFTLGIGAYYRYMPFKNSDSKVLQGLTASSSVRYWQNVGSTQSSDEFSYFSEKTGKKELLKVPNIGVANTPIIINIGVGYTFGGK